MLLGGAARQLRAGRTEYEAPVCDVLRLLAKPMRSVRTSDDKRYEQSMAALIRTASSLLRVGVPSVSACAAQMLLQIVISPGSRPSSRNGSPIGASRTMLSATRAQQLVASSGALQNLVAVLAAPTEGGTESSLTLASLRALRQLSRHEANALQIVRAEHVGALLGLLSQPLGSPCLSLAVEVLWNALDAAEAETAALLGRPQGMAALTDLLGRACASSAEADKELRNEVLVVLSKLAQALDPSGRELLVSHGALPLALALITHDVRLFVAQAARGSPPFEAIERVSCTMNGVAAQLPPVPPASAEPIPSRLQFELIELAMHLMQVRSACPLALPLARPHRPSLLLHPHPFPCAAGPPWVRDVRIARPATARAGAYCLRRGRVGVDARAAPRHRPPNVRPRGVSPTRCSASLAPRRDG